MINWSMAVIVIVIFFISVFIIWSKKECSQLSVESINIVSDKNITSTKIIFLSDLHDKVFGEDNEYLISEIEKNMPDIIMIGGDTMNTHHGNVDFAVTKDLILKLKNIAPIYYANGNNEQRLTWESDKFGDSKNQLIRLLKDNDVHYLEDSYSDIGGVRVYGINLEPEHYHEFWNKKLTVDFIENAIGTIDQKKFNILLCHSPMFINAYAEWGADLVLAGHSHGGVIRFPTDRKKEKGKINNDLGLTSGQYQLFHKYCAGVFWKDKTCMIVSRGLGTHTVNIRINNLPQIIVVNIDHQEQFI